MKYPVAIEWGDEQHATSIIFPDIPNAMTAGDTIEQAYEMAVEVAHIQLEELASAGQPIPLPDNINDHRQKPDYEGWGWGMIDIDVTVYLGKAENFNVTLPAHLILQIDQYMKLHDIKSRSAFIASAALEKLHRQ